MRVPMAMPGSRSTPLRLTGLLILVFTLSSLVTFGIAYLLVRGNFDSIQREQLRQSMESYLSADGADDLVERLSGDVATVDPFVRIFRYLPDDGAPIGNVADLPRVADFTVLPETAVRAANTRLSDSYLAYGARVPGGWLTIAETREQATEMGEIFATVVLVGLLPTLVIASGIGLVAAVRVRDRVEAIRATLRDLTHGGLDARVPNVTEQADDLEQIGVAVNRMADAQAASVASLRQVSADIAHDLRTPIQRVAILLDRLGGRDQLNPGQRAIVDAATRETEQIVATFQALLQIAQIEGGGARDRFVRVELHDLIARLIDVYGPAAEESGHRLEATPASAPVRVRGDPRLLGQVLANLIENGLRHVAPGGRISIAAFEGEGGAVLEVSDDGPGIPEAERGNVLRRLYRLERSRTSPGNGLGLSLVAAICGLHDASLDIGDNHPGLRVTVRFPASDPLD